MYVTRYSWETVKSAHVAPKPRVLFKTQRSAHEDSNLTFWTPRKKNHVCMNLVLFNSC